VTTGKIVDEVRPKDLKIRDMCVHDCKENNQAANVEFVIMSHVDVASICLSMQSEQVKSQGRDKKKVTDQ
jgi:hypothetical protein